MFKKNNAVYHDKMKQLSKVTVTEQGVHFTLNYSSIDLTPEAIPGLLADVIELYAYMKPTLERLQAERDKNKTEPNTPPEDEPIDLTGIPF